jgi:hypothetical protein
MISGKGTGVAVGVGVILGTRVGVLVGIEVGMGVEGSAVTGCGVQLERTRLAATSRIIGTASAFLLVFIFLLRSAVTGPTSLFVKWVVPSETTHFIFNFARRNVVLKAPIPGGQ